MEREELLALLSERAAGMGRALPLWQRKWLALFFAALGFPLPDIPT